MFFRRKSLNVLMTVALLAIGLFVGHAVFAQVDTGLTELSSTGLSQEDPRIIVAKVIKIILSFLGILFLSLVIYGGFLWMIAGGSDQKQEKARKTLVSAVIGLVIVLSAYAITSFIITRLGAAMGTQIDAPAGTGGTGGVGDEGGGTAGGVSFYAKSFMPKGKTDAYNVKVRVLFNKEVKENSVGGNFIVRDIAANKEVAGKVEVSGAQITFTPSEKCAEDAAQFCFSKNTQYEIEVGAGLRSAADMKITCNMSFLCKAQFATGALFDNVAPKVFVTYPAEWQSVKANSVLSLQAKATDNLGVASVDFVFDDKVVGVDQPKLGVTKDFDASYDFDLTGVVLGKHLAQAKAFDMDSNSAVSSSVGFYVKSESCFDAKDELICGKPECGLCDGGKCTDGSQCASGECDKVKGSCVDLPIITGVAPAKGGSGNFVTISGKYFEDLGPSSKVEFKDAKGAWIKAELGCGAKSWTKNQIIAVVPSGAATGAIRVTNKKGYSDATDDVRGWKGSFTYDANVKWPGLCSVTNALGIAEAKFSDLVVAEGSGFGDSRTDGDNVYFGEFSADIGGAWQDKKIIGIKVPNLKSGVINVKVANNNVLSNAVAFEILTSENLPAITGISPNNGGKGQYFTISGSNFGDSVGQIQFVKEDDPSKIYVAEFGCAQGGWTNAQIVAKVPSKIPADKLGKFSVRIVKGDSQSNQVSFDVNSKSVTPGLCYVKPKNGPAGTKVEIVGEEFGDSQGDAGRVVFYSGAEAKDGLVWVKDKISNIIVPQTAKSGPLYVINAAGLKSNEVNFNVGTCSATSCADGETCCNGLCLPADECKAAGLMACEYAWTFSTGLLPIYPEVLEIPVCSKDYPESPSPMNALKNACPNAEISAVFNTLMDIGSFPDNVVVSACNSQKNDCDLSNCSKQGADCHNLSAKELGDKPFEFRIVNYLGEDRTQVALKLKLQTNLKYRVTLLAGTKGLKSSNGLNMIKPYFWDFTTGENTCSVDHILIIPSKALINEYEGETQYLAQCVAKNCNVIDCPENSKWQWGFSNEGYANSRAAMDWDEGENFSTVKAIAETDESKDIEIFSVFKSFDPKLPGEYGETANLKIKFLDPKVIDFYPACGTACPNTLVYAAFNTNMLIENDWQGKVNVFPCLSKACTTFAAAGQLSGDILYNGKLKTVNFMLAKNSMLLPSTYYRVVIDGDILSSSKKVLSDLNYDKNSDGKTDSFSWTFKTKDDSAACKPQKATVLPQKATSVNKGEYILYQANPIGDPLGCDGTGELLSPAAYAWSWESTKESVATISAYQRNLEFPEYCNAQCQVKGSVPKDKASICGNGKIENGEECDDGNSKDGDGCGAKCLSEGTVLCGPGVNQNCCGNKIKEKSEDCDDGNAKDQDGCSSKCLNEGSTVAGFVCGNGKIEYGEDCDDGNVKAKDGCNSQCLFEGALYVFGKEPAICGNGKFEFGEECESNEAGCDKTCVWKGTSKCTTAGESNCCGNSKIEAGEECEVYDAWCTKNCLKKGSVSSLGAVCGNGKAEPGEDGECECENGLNVDKKGDKCVSLIDGKAPGHFYQMAKVVGELPKDKFYDETNIFAYPWDIKAVTKLLTGKEVLPAILAFSSIGYSNGPVPGPDPDVKPKTCEGYGAVAFEKTSPSANEKNVCQNASILLEFNQPLNLESLNNKIVIKKFLGPIQTPELEIVVTSWQDENSGNTKAMVVPVGLFDKGATYMVTVKEGIIDSCGKGTADNLIFTFSTGGACKVSEMTVVPASRMFTKPAEEQEFSVLFKSGNNYIHEVAGQYEWSIGWEMFPALAKDIVGLKSSAKNPKAEEVIVAFAKDKEGTDNLLYSTLTVTVDKLFGGGEKGSVLKAAANIDVIFCDKPWFWNSNKYSTEQTACLGKFNFKMFYCRDGKKDSNEALPLIKDVAGSVNQAQSPKTFCEVFFVRDAGEPGASQSDYDYVTDAISLRVSENQGSLPVELWYKKFVPNPSGPQSVIIDGYQAIKDGRTVYVSGANVSDDKKIYNNIYLFSYTDKANANTLNIVGQLLKYLRFNTNVEAVAKQSVQRDTKRINDAAFAKYLLDAYFENYQDYPKLDAGSYVKNLTYSAWPSWQEELGKDLQNALPEDPLNYFATVPQLSAEKVSVGGTVDAVKYEACETGSGYCEKSVSQCVEGTATCRLCPVGYDVNTCYDSVSKKFISQVGEYQPLYSYKYLPASKLCQFNYSLETESVFSGYQYIGKPIVCEE